MRKHQPDATRFEELYRQHAGAVYAFARRRSTPETAEDVTADTFATCWRRLHDVPPDALPWLYAVARKTLANRHRLDDRRRRLALRAVAPTATDDERDPRLALAFRALSPRDREVLALVAWEGLSLPEAATALGCSPVACRVRFHRAKRRLAEQLARVDRSASLAANPKPKGAT